MRVRLIRAKTNRRKGHLPFRLLFGVQVAALTLIVEVDQLAERMASAKIGERSVTANWPRRVLVIRP